MRKRVISAILACVMVMGTMVGCGNSEGTTNASTATENTKETGSEAVTSETVVEEGVTIPFAEPVDLEILYPVGGNLGSENQVLEAAFEMTNVNANLISAPSASYEEKLNSILASGELPDIVYLTEAQMNSWIAEGALMPLDDLIEKYGDNIKNTLVESDYSELRTVDDGQIYGLPYILRIPAQFVMGIRRDWLEKLDLEVPTDIDSLEKVLTTFKDNASVLGVENLIPFVGNNKEMGYFTAIFDAYGISRSGENAAWTLDADGNYISVYEHPNYEACLETLARWYQNGLVDPEYLARANADIHTLFNSGVAGCGFVYSTRLSTYTQAIREVTPEALVDYMQPIVGVDGEQRAIGRSELGNRACITIAAADKLEECIKYLDWFYSEEGETLMNYGIEDVSYNMVDGEPVITEEYNQGWDNIRLIGCVDTNLAYNRSLDAYYQCMLYGKELEECDELELLTYTAYVENEPFVVKPLRTFSTETSKSKGTDIYATLAEKEAKVINGSITIEEFREALAQAKANGLDAMTAEMQACWDAVN